MCLLQTAHAPHVLFVRNGMDDRAGAQEKQRLEEGVGEQVEDRDVVGTDAERHEHVAELRARRVSDHAFDVVLDAADRGSEKRGGRADKGHEGQRGMR